MTLAALIHFFSQRMVRDSIQIGADAFINPASGALELSPESNLKVRQAIEREVSRIRRRLLLRRAFLRFHFSATEIFRDFSCRCKNLRLHDRIHFRAPRSGLHP